MEAVDGGAGADERAETVQDQVVRPSRRAVLGVGAAGVGAVAASVVPAVPAFGQAVGTAPVGGEAAAQAAGLPPAFIPVVPPGALVGYVGFAGVTALATTGAASAPSLVYTSGGVYTPTAGCFLVAPIPLDTGARLIRVDAYWKRSVQGTSSGALNKQWFENGNTYSVGSYSQPGNGVISDAYVFPSPTAVEPGFAYYVEANNTSASNMFMGILYQYYPAKAQLNLVPGTPARIYDTRPGNNPATPPKVPLGFGTVRANIDARANGSSVPAGATAILANVTVVNTKGSGYLAVTKNNSGIPLFSTINWFGPGQVLANTTVIALDANGLFQAYVGLSSETDFFVDVLGYYI